MSAPIFNGDYFRPVILDLLYLRNGPIQFSSIVIMHLNKIYESENWDN